MNALVTSDGRPLPPDQRPAPANIEAEQALLGILLYDNATFIEVDGHIQGRDFFEPFHARLFKAISDLVRAGRLADPILLRSLFAIDPAFHELGGTGYLADLIDQAPNPQHAKDFALEIRNAALRRDVIRIAHRSIDRASGDAEVTGADLMADMEREMLAVRTGKTDLEMQTWSEVSLAVIHSMDAPVDDERALITFGLEKVDEVLGGAERGDLVVIGARPSMGKSALASCIALNVAKRGLGVAEINAEMTTQQMARRHLTDQAFWAHGDSGPMYRDIRRRNLTDQQKAILYQVQAEQAQLPLVMIKRSGLTLGRLAAMLRRQKMLWTAAGVRLSLVVVDHVGLIRPDETRGSRVDDQTIVSGGLKQLAEDLDVVILALAQLNRQVEAREDKRPQLADLRDSGSWEQDADIVMGVYRDAYYARREREPKKFEEQAQWLIRAGSKEVECIMLKIREGETGTAKLWADIGRNAIRDRDPSFIDFAELPFSN